MTIIYRTEQAFYDGVAALVARGLTFRADFEGMTVTLLGGY
ncbi:hypothetical protein [Cupriavidus taiwanensis]|nr:hypothetical protein [Cupriavidus taiwanensis]SPA50630.1 protein of unknown function [Cupriavidus taiwanensis]